MASRRGGRGGASGDWKQKLRFESGEEHFVEDQLAFAYVLEKLKDHADPPQECQFDLPPNQEWVFEVRCPIGNCRYGNCLIAKRSTWQEAVGQLLWHMLKDPEHGGDFEEAAHACEHKWPKAACVPSKEFLKVASENGVHYKPWEPEPEAAEAASSSVQVQAVKAAVQQTFEEIMQKSREFMAARGQDENEMVEVPKIAMEGVVEGLRRASLAIESAQEVSHHCAQTLHREQAVLEKLKDQLFGFMVPQEALVPSPQAKRARKE